MPRLRMHSSCLRCEHNKTGLILCHQCIMGPKTTKSAVCTYCSKANHTEEQCFAKKNAAK